MPALDRIFGQLLHWELYTSDPVKYMVRRIGSRFPYVDLFQYKEMGDLIIPSPYNIPQNKSNIFPLIMRPFEGTMFPAPRNPYKFLETNYGTIDECQLMDHWLAGRNNNRIKCRIQCSKLYAHLPFVHRISKNFASQNGNKSDSDKNKEENSTECLINDRLVINTWRIFNE